MRRRVGGVEGLHAWQHTDFIPQLEHASFLSDGGVVEVGNDCYVSYDA